MNPLPLLTFDSLYSPEQTTSAQNILNVFIVAIVRVALLISQCQAGKTGAFHKLISLMRNRKMIDRVYIVCGSSETILRAQAFADSLKFNEPDTNEGLIKIIFHQDFEKNTMNIENALIIIDESHQVQTINQGLHTFFLRHGITMDGNPEILDTKNTYIVSVDATPYSEVASLKHVETRYEKHIECLQPGVGYRGLKNFLDDGLIRPAFSIAKYPQQFKSIVEVFIQDPQYIIIRLNGGKESIDSEINIAKICDDLKIPLLYYTTERTDIAITESEKNELQRKNKMRNLPCLESKPETTTIVIIRGRLRAGKVAPKEHIGFVWESAKSSKTDTIVQGLVGRMCGYHDRPIPMYVPAAFLNENPGKLIPQSELARAIDFYDKQKLAPRKGMNLKLETLITAPPGVTYCVPFRLQWDGNQLEDLADDQIALQNEGLALLRRNIHLIDEYPYYTPEQKAEIITNAQSGVRPHGRFMVPTSSGSYLKQYQSYMNGYKNHTQSSEPVSGYPEITCVFTFPGFQGLTHDEGIIDLTGDNSEDNVYGHVLFLFYTKARGTIDTIHKPSRISTTNGKSIFSLDTATFEQPVGMGGFVGISENDLQDPVKFEEGLRAYITLWKTSTLLVSRQWVPCSTTSRINKLRYHYVDKGNNDVEKICRRLEIELFAGMKRIKTTYARQGLTIFNLKTISW
jgi:hypothetical protein